MDHNIYLCCWLYASDLQGNQAPNPDPLSHSSVDSTKLPNKNNAVYKDDKHINNIACHEIVFKTNFMKKCSKQTLKVRSLHGAIMVHVCDHITDIIMEFYCL